MLIMSERRGTRMTFKISFLFLWGIQYKNNHKNKTSRVDIDDKMQSYIINKENSHIYYI